MDDHHQDEVAVDENDEQETNPDEEMAESMVTNNTSEVAVSVSVYDGEDNDPARQTTDDDTVRAVQGTESKVDQYLARLAASGVQLSQRHHHHDDRHHLNEGENEDDEDRTESTDSFGVDGAIHSAWELNLPYRKRNEMERKGKRRKGDEMEDDDDDEEEEEEDDGEGGSEEEDGDQNVEETFESAEAAEALYQKRLELIDRYLIAKKEYKYMLKKNDYLQDKLFKICVRKGFIVENKFGIEEEEDRRKKKKKKFALKTSIAVPTTPTMTMTMGQENENSIFDGLDEEEEKVWEAAMAEQQQQQQNSEMLGPPHHQLGVLGMGGTSTGIKNFMEAAFESKYAKVVRRIWEQERSKIKDALTHKVNVGKIKDKSEKWNKIHQDKFSNLMTRVRESSEAAIDSNTGRHLPRWETDQFIDEVTKIHGKLCKTMAKMYQNRHGLEFALKLLEVSEVQGEGLQMLEYEQLQAENYSLKEKLEDRQKDVENIKAKIGHAVQILAHFRECMNKHQEKMEDCNSKLSLINKRVYQVREITDVVTQRYEVFKEDEKNLVSESGLLDNTKLLRDFEKTHYDVLDLKEEKRKLQKQLAVKTREVEAIQSKIRDVQMNLPELQKLAKQERQVKQNTLTKTKKSVQPDTKPADDPREAKRKKMQRLEFLLEKRALDPPPTSKNGRLMSLDYKNTIKIPIIAKYKCRFAL